jgi:protease-4
MAKRRDWIVGIIIAGSFMLFVAFSVLLLVGLSETDGVEFSGFGDKVAIVDLKGPIRSSETVVKQLRRFGEDESVPAIVLRVDSPGGGVSASQEIYNEVLRVRDKGKTVVVSMGSVAASGGLYVAVAADHVVANPGSLTGSIGVIMQFPTAERLFDKIGLQYETIKSGEFKDVGNMSRDMTDAEAAALQTVIDDTYEQFIEAVADGRGLELDSVRQFADGRIFTGRQAMELGLVDELGDLHDAINIAAEWVGLETPPKTVRAIERRRPSLLDFLGEMAVAWLAGLAEDNGGMTPSLQYRFR